MTVWIVIPAYNEARVIRAVLDGVRKKYQHVVVVDDASTDGTASQARAAGVTVLEHVINRGQGAALKTGIDYALAHGADTVVTFDADGQHDPNDIDVLVAPIASGQFDVALGSRFLAKTSNIPPLRRFVLRLGVIFTRLLSNIRVTDTHNGLRAFSRQAAQKVKIVQDRMAHASEILDEIVRHGLRYTEVPVTITYNDYSREKGQGNLAMFKIAIKFILFKITH